MPENARNNNVEYIYNTNLNNKREMFNLVHCFEEAGAIPRVAKTCATKICNRYGIEIKNGMLPISESKTMLEEYKNRKNTSKYKDQMIHLMDALSRDRKKDLPKRLFEPLKNFSTVDPFQAVFLLERVLNYLVEKEDYDTIAFYEKAHYDMKNTIYE
jgi:hypothetical protein